jgi:cobyrinic acid a,c-diamide synthase
MDLDGSVSTAEIAKILESPVMLIADCTKVTRTVAALVLGCRAFDTGVPLKGVILNRLAGQRHESVIRQSIERYCSLPVVGAIPKLTDITFPGRHLGLVPPEEHPTAREAIETSAGIVEKYLDLEQLWQIARKAPPLDVVPEKYPDIPSERVDIGVIRDSAFQFYYPENIDALKRAGARVIEFSALMDDFPPSVHALYIGGGFPETHAQALSDNVRLRKAIKKAVEDGLPVYAECGGLMYLSEKLIWQDNTYPMVGVLPFTIGISSKPQGHGYTTIEVNAPNPFFPTGQVLRGHEFHYSYVLNIAEKPGSFFAFRMKRGKGISGGMDGFCYRNVLATYTHVHALGTREWVHGVMSSAAEYKKKNLSAD